MKGTPMTKSELHDLLTDTARNLQHAHRDHHAATCSVTDLKRHLARAEAEHILAGLEGKNAEARKAELANLTTQERRALETAEEKLDNTRLNLTLTELDHRLTRDLLKLHTNHQEDNS